MLSAPATAFVPQLLSADVIINVAPTATAAPVPSAVIDDTAAYFSAAATTAYMFQHFRLHLCFKVSLVTAAAASVPIAITTIVSAKALSKTRGTKNP